MNFLLFLAPFSWGTQKREAAAPKASGCFMGGTCGVREEPGKQNPRRCRAQELARSSARENVRQKKVEIPKSVKSRRRGPEGVRSCHRGEKTAGLAHTVGSKRALDSGLYSR